MPDIGPIGRRGAKVLESSIESRIGSDAAAKIRQAVKASTDRPAAEVAAELKAKDTVVLSGNKGVEAPVVHEPHIGDQVEISPTSATDVDLATWKAKLARLEAGAKPEDRAEIAALTRKIAEAEPAVLAHVGAADVDQIIKDDILGVLDHSAHDTYVTFDEAVEVVGSHEAIYQAGMARWHIGDGSAQIQFLHEANCEKLMENLTDIRPLNLESAPQLERVVRFRDEESPTGFSDYRMLITKGKAGQFAGSLKQYELIKKDVPAEKREQFADEMVRLWDYGYEHPAALNPSGWRVANGGSHTIVLSDWDELRKLPQPLPTGGKAQFESQLRELLGLPAKAS